jgi:hypothetical protein
MNYNELIFENYVMKSKNKMKNKIDQYIFDCNKLQSFQKKKFQKLPT